MTRGSFIAIEGVDGGGKTGAIAYLTKALEQQGHEVVATREPGGTDEGMALRALLLSDRGPVWEPKAELLLMTAARIQHVARLVKPAVASGKIVLCDRYVGSTLAYQGGGRGLDEGLIRALHRDFVDDYWPDLTLLLDVDPRIGLRRSQARLAAETVDEGRFEGLDLGFHDRVRQAFIDLASNQLADKVAVIDASRSAADVQDDALRFVLEHLRRPLP